MSAAPTVTRFIFSTSLEAGQEAESAKWLVITAMPITQWTDRAGDLFMSIDTLMGTGRMPRSDINEFFEWMVEHCLSTVLVHRENPYLRPDGEDVYFTWVYLMAAPDQAFTYRMRWS